MRFAALALLILLPAGTALAHDLDPACYRPSPEAYRVQQDTAGLLWQGRQDPAALQKAAEEVGNFFQRIIPQAEVYTDNTGPFPVTWYVYPSC